MCEEEELEVALNRLVRKESIGTAEKVENALFGSAVGIGVE